MLALLLIPAILGTAFVISEVSDDDSNNEQDNEVTPPLTHGDDILSGDGSAQNWHAGDGDDSISGNGGDDTLAGGNGADTLSGGNGSDSLSGGAGGDSLQGGRGDDVIHGNSGDDYVAGDLGHDQIFLGDGNDEYSSDLSANPDTDSDEVHGGSGNDTISDAGGSNMLFGDAGNDHLTSVDSGAYLDINSVDTLHGGDGDDTLRGDDGDIMTGGAGADIFEAVHTFDDSTDAIVIEDFDTSEDVLYAELLSTGLSATPGGPFDPDVTFDAASGEIRVSTGGETFAVLRNMTAADVDELNIAITVASA